MPHLSPWAKLERGVPHELACRLSLNDHCLDVAVVMEALLRGDTRRQRLARLGGMTDLDAVQVARLCVIAAMHDLGKANHGFQAKADPATRVVAGHVAEAVSALESETLVDGARLGDALAEAVDLDGLDAWCSGDQAGGDLLLAAIQHHGGPVGLQRVDMLRGPVASLWTARGEADPVARVVALREASLAAFPASARSDGAALPATPAFQHAFSGLVMLADWLGSDAEVFAYAEGPGATAPGGPDRLPWARARAAALLAEVGLDAPAFTTHDVQRAVLGVDRSPRAAQAAVLDLPLPDGASTLLIESDTGSGKTEAALLWWARLQRAGRVDGLYFALPTRAAARQLHARVEAAARRLWGDAAPSVLLAVPGYAARPPLASAVHLFDERPDGGDRFASRRSWASEHPKRFLAAGVAVGTVDQVLLSTLNVQHSRMRAAGLLRSLLVVDEVHASDAYMGRLLAEVLRRQAAAGGHACLLSATLGAAARAALLDDPCPPLSDAVERPWPCVVTRDAGGLRELGLVPDPERARQVQLSWRRGTEPEALAEVALTHARAGARVLVLRNTVGDAVATQQALEAAGGEAMALRCAGQAAPHHARFTHADRDALDRAVEAALSPSGPQTPVVVVATQTVEQSLDLDADVLLTDLAPADVLLQRIGRVHRHRRTGRPAAYEAPRVEVLLPDEGALASLAAQAEPRGPHGWGTVYDDLGVLALTELAVVERPVWSLPEDNRALVEGTTHPDARARLAGEAWAAQARRVVGAQFADRRFAQSALADWTHAFCDPELITSAPDERLTTRLGAADRELQLADPLPALFGGAPTATLRISSYLAGGLHPEGEAQWAPDGEGFAITSGDAHFRYDRYGLRRETR